MRLPGDSVLDTLGPNYPAKIHQAQRWNTTFNGDSSNGPQDSMERAGIPSDNRARKHLPSSGLENFYNVEHVVENIPTAYY